MSKEIRILFLEDAPTDAELNERELRKDGIAYTGRRVDTRLDFLRELDEFRPDIILSDFGMPQFNGLEALRLLRARGCGTPFILITGSLTEEVAVEVMKAGASDYILKTSLKRLPSAVRNALEKAEAARAHGEAVESLRRSEEQYRDLFENANDLIFTQDLAGNITSLNKAGERITGYTREEALTLNLTQVVAPEYMETTRRMTARKLAGETVTTTYELEIVRKDGQRVTLELSTRLMHHDGEVVGVQGIGRDITERKRVESERDTERRLLDALVERLPVGVLFRDNEGRYTRANAMASEILEIGHDRLVGMMADDLIELMQPVDQEGNLITGATAHSRRAIENQLPVEASPVMVTTLAGNKRRLVVNAAPVTLSGQEPFGSVIVLNDVTEQQAIQEQLRQSQKMEAIGQLAGGVAHDFNNLLTAILGNTQLALRKLAPEDPLRQRLLEVEKAGQRATSLTRQLLAFSRRQHLDRRAIDLNDTIGDMMKMVRRIIGEDVDVRIKGASNLPPVFADPAQVEQVVMNLCVNARDAMPGGGTLTVETHYAELDEAYCRHHSFARPGHYVEIRVSDTGMGMDAKTQARIFEPFFTTKEIGKGTGLGLAMVYGIVKQHDGHINVYSELGHGSIFKVYLPLADRPTEREVEQKQLALPGGTETILVAEDEAALRALAKDILEGLGYEVLLAENGERAVEIYKEARERINLLLIDVVMPQMGGHAAYERIRALGNGIPAIFMTGYSTDTVQDRFVKSERLTKKTGAALIQKPYSVESLGRKVREVLDGARKE